MTERLELDNELITKHGIREVFYDSKTIEIHYIGKDGKSEVISLRVLQYAHDTIQQLDFLIDGSMNLEAFTYLKWYLGIKFPPKWNEIYQSAPIGDINNSNGNGSEKEKEKSQIH